MAKLGSLGIATLMAAATGTGLSGPAVPQALAPAPGTGAVEDGVARRLQSTINLALAELRSVVDRGSAERALPEVERLAALVQKLRDPEATAVELEAAATTASNALADLRIDANRIEQIPAAQEVLGPMLGRIIDNLDMIVERAG